MIGKKLGTCSHFKTFGPFLDTNVFTWGYKNVSHACVTCVSSQSCYGDGTTGVFNTGPYRTVRPYPFIFSFFYMDP